MYRFHYIQRAIGPADLMPWQAGHHPDHDGQLWPHGHLADAPSLSGPVTCKELFFKWCIALLCRWHGLAAGPQGSALWFSNWSMPLIPHDVFFPSQITLISVGSAQSFDSSNMVFALHLRLAVTQSWQPSMLPGKWIREISLSGLQILKRPTRHWLLP